MQVLKLVNMDKGEQKIVKQPTEIRVKNHRSETKKVP